jgi:hypothetical protein
LNPSSSARTIGPEKMMGRSVMEIPWDEPATVWIFARGLDRRRADLKGDLRTAVLFALSQSNSDGDGYIVALDDGSAQWEGPEIAALAHQLENR